MRKHLKRISAVLAACVVGGTIAVAGLAPAQAAVTDCASGSFCLWQYNDQNNYLYGNSGHASYVGSNANDRSNSIFNRGNSCTTRFYENQGYTGRYGDLSRGNGYNKLSSWFISPAETWSNRISSFYWMC